MTNKSSYTGPVSFNGHTYPNMEEAVTALEAGRSRCLADDIRDGLLEVSMVDENMNDDERDVLQAIKDAPGIHVNDLEEPTNLSQNRIYKALVKLEKLQLIERDCETMCVTAVD